MIKMPKFIVESDIVVHTLARPFHSHQTVVELPSLEEAYDNIKKYIADTKEIFTAFARHTICSREELEQLVNTDMPVAVNIVIGQFEDELYIKKSA